MKVLASKLDDPAAWREARRRVVTASEIPVIVRGGAARAALLAEKRSGEWRDLSHVPAIAHGLAREPALTAWASLKWPDVAQSELLLAADVNERHAATCDLLGVSSVVELKTGIHPWEACPSAPKYRDQVLWQMHVTEHREAWLVYERHDGGVPVDFEPTVVPVKWDAERVAVLVEAADVFLAELDDDTVEVVPLDLDLDVLARRYLDEHEAEKQRTAAKKAAWADLHSRLADAGSVSQETDGARVTWTVAEKPKVTVDEAAAREANPELAEMWDALIAAHTTTEMVRESRLTVTRPKEKP